MSSGRVITRGGLRPSDRFDPIKREFLTNLSYKILHLVCILIIRLIFYINILLLEKVLELFQIIEYFTFVIWKAIIINIIFHCEKA
jgi:hypothetical protein